MKDPLHYLTQARATHPTDPAPEAVRLALVDGETEKQRYAHLLVRALLRARAEGLSKHPTS